MGRHEQTRMVEPLDFDEAFTWARGASDDRELDVSHRLARSRDTNPDALYACGRLFASRDTNPEPFYAKSDRSADAVSHSADAMRTDATVGATGDYASDVTSANPARNSMAGAMTANPARDSMAAANPARDSMAAANPARDSMAAANPGAMTANPARDSMAGATTAMNAAPARELVPAADAMSVPRGNVVPVMDETSARGCVVRASSAAVTADTASGNVPYADDDETSCSGDVTSDADDQSYSDDASCSDDDELCASGGDDNDDYDDTNDTNDTNNDDWDWDEDAAMTRSIRSMKGGRGKVIALILCGMFVLVTMVVASG